jgi:hypothetical protein
MPPVTAQRWNPKCSYCCILFLSLTSRKFKNLPHRHQGFNFSRHTHHGDPKENEMMDAKITNSFQTSIGDLHNARKHTSLEIQRWKWHGANLSKDPRIETESVEMKEWRLFHGFQRRNVANAIFEDEWKYSKSVKEWEYHVVMYTCILCLGKTSSLLLPLFIRLGVRSAWAAGFY